MTFATECLYTLSVRVAYALLRCALSAVLYAFLHRLRVCCCLSCALLLIDRVTHVLLCVSACLSGCTVNSLSFSQFICSCVLSCDQVQFSFAGMCPVCCEVSLHMSQCVGSMRTNEFSLLMCGVLCRCTFLHALIRPHAVRCHVSSWSVRIIVYAYITTSPRRQTLKTGETIPHLAPPLVSMQTYIHPASTRIPVHTYVSTFLCNFGLNHGGRLWKKTKPYYFAAFVASCKIYWSVRLRLEFRFKFINWSIVFD